MFENELYRRALFKRPSDHWVPLISLFTGARQAEICQLTRNDIYQDPDSKIFVIDINDQEQKQVKTKSSIRKVPVHPQLLQLGFLDYLTGMSELQPIFPELERNKNNEFSAYSKRFNRHRKFFGVDGGATHRVDFHSFRYNVLDYLYGRGCEEYVVTAIVGHDDRKNIGLSIYAKKGPDVLTRYKVIEQLRYDIDFSKIKRFG